MRGNKISSRFTETENLQRVLLKASSYEKTKKERLSVLYRGGLRGRLKCGLGMFSAPRGGAHRVCVCVCVC